MSIQHVEPLERGWGVREDHEGEFREEFSTEHEAVHHAWHAAGIGGQVIVHEPDGSTEVFIRTDDSGVPAAAA